MKANQPQWRRSMIDGAWYVLKEDRWVPEDEIRQEAEETEEEGDGDRRWTT